MPEQKIADLEARARRFRVAVITMLTIELITITVVGLSFALTRNGLCTFHDELQSRTDSTEKLLERRPRRDPIHAFGLTVPRAVLANQVRQQNRTLDSLSGLRC